MAWFGFLAFVFSLVGLAAYQRVDKLEKRLKELELIEADFDSEASDDPSDREEPDTRDR